MNYIKSLDGLRALAVIMVILFHYYYGRFWGFGWIGVQLFLVLSGFLITSILLNAKTKSWNLYFGEFYWRRALRIFPLYFGFLLAVFIAFLVVGFPSNFPEVAPYLFTYTYNFLPLLEGYKIDFVFTHFWSLSVEEQFYIFWPFIIFFLNSSQLKLLVLFLLVASPVIRFGLYEYLMQTGNYELHDLGQIIYRFTPAQVDAFALGGAIPIFALTEKVNTGKILKYSLLLLAGGFLLSNITLDNTSLFSWFSGYKNGDTDNYQHVWTYTVINLFAAALVMYLSVNKNWLSKIFEWNPIVQIGKVSYGMYIFHWPLKSAHMIFIDKHIQQPIISFGIYFLVVFIISYISFKLFESRFLNFKSLILKK